MTEILKNERSVYIAFVVGIWIINFGFLFSNMAGVVFPIIFTIAAILTVVIFVNVISQMIQFSFGKNMGVEAKTTNSLRIIKAIFYVSFLISLILGFSSLFA